MQTHTMLAKAARPTLLILQRFKVKKISATTKSISCKSAIQNNYNKASSGTTSGGQSTNVFFARPFLDPLESIDSFASFEKSVDELSISIYSFCPFIFGPINAVPLPIIAQAEATGP